MSPRPRVPVSVALVRFEGDRHGQVQGRPEASAAVVHDLEWIEPDMKVVGRRVVALRREDDGHTVGAGAEDDWIEDALEDARGAWRSVGGAVRRICLGGGRLDDRDRIAVEGAETDAACEVVDGLLRARKQSARLRMSETVGESEE